MTIYSFSIDNLESSEINNILFSTNPKGTEGLIPEIEFRLGKIEYKSDINKNIFKTSIFYKEWNKIFSNIFNYKKYSSFIKKDDTIEIIGNLRKIISKEPDNIEYQEKIKYFDDFIDPKTGRKVYTKYDTFFNIVTNFKKKGIEHKPYITGVRLAKAFEKPIKEEDYNARLYSSSQGYKKVFKRERSSFVFDNFIIDFTIRKEIGKNEYQYGTYEIEIEFKPEFLKKILLEPSSRLQDSLTKNINPKNNFKIFMNEIKIAFSYLFPKLNTLYTETQFNSINKQLIAINQESKNKFFKPVNIQEKHISGKEFRDTQDKYVTSQDNLYKENLDPKNGGLTNFSVTNKLDGVGYNLSLIYIDNPGNGPGNTTPTYCLILHNPTDIFLVSQISKKSIQQSNEESKFKNMICQCEVRFLSENVEINLYDCIFIKDIPALFKKSLNERINVCNDIISFLSDNFKTVGTSKLSFKLKPYFYSENINQMITNCLTYMNSYYDGEKLTDTNDGIIFQYNGSSNAFPALKWKFYSKITIDFTARKKSSQKSEDPNSSTTTYDLLSYNGEDLILYDPSFNITVNNIDLFDGIQATNLEDYVLECGYNINTKKWFIHRIRFDKSTHDSNYVTVVKDTYYDIINEMTLPILIKKINSYRSISETEKQIPLKVQEPHISKCLDNYRKFHNKIKEKIILKYCSKEIELEKIILDLGAGKGGDLPKYRSANVKKIYAVEPNHKNLEEMTLRLENAYRDLLNKVSKINVGAEDTDILSSKIFEKVDVINMFFVLSFFFKDRTMLLKLVETIDTFLIKDGVFIGTFMDGNIVKQELMDKDIIKDCYYIKSLNVRSDNSVYGQKIEIDYKGTETATRQEEYLIFIEELFHLLSYKGIYPVIVDNFDKLASNIEQYKLLNDEEKYLNSFYKYFVCKKNNKIETTILPTKINTPMLCPIKGKIPEIYNEYWYRFSAPADGSCFFHSVCKSLLRNDYNPMSVIKMRENIASRLSINDYIELYNGEKAILDFQIIVLNTINITCFKKYPEHIHSKNLLTNYISNTFDEIQALLPNNKLTNLNQVIDYLIKKLKNEGFEEQELINIFNAYKTYNYTQFFNEASNCESFAEEWMINYLQTLLKINIIIIHSNSLKPLSTGFIYDPNNVSIVIYNIDNQHFEPIFRRNSIFDKNFQTTFSMKELTNLFTESESKFFY